MRNLLLVARKEYVDILSSRMVLLIIVLFILYMINCVYNFSVTANGNGPPGAMLGIGSFSVGTAAVNAVFYTMTAFGAIIGVVIGCSTIASDRMGHALNTLLAKPVYRDTIINGKILGSLAFLATYMALVTAIFTAALLVFCGTVLAPSLGDYLSRLPFVYIYTLLFVGVFLSLGMFVSLLVRDQAVAMIITVIIVLLFQESYVLEDLNNLFPALGLMGLLNDLSPFNLALQSSQVWANSSQSAFDEFVSVLPDIQQLVLSVVIVLVFSYIVFARRDVS